MFGPGRLNSSQLPRCAKRPREQLAGGRVADDLLAGHIPVDFAAGEHGDEAEVAGQRGVMAGLGWCDGGFA